MTPAEYKLLGAFLRGVSMFAAPDPYADVSHPFHDRKTGRVLGHRGRTIEPWEFDTMDPQALAQACHRGCVRTDDLIDTQHHHLAGHAMVGEDRRANTRERNVSLEYDPREGRNAHGKKYRLPPRPKDPDFNAYIQKCIESTTHHF